MAKSLGEKFSDALGSGFSTAFSWVQDKVADTIAWGVEIILEAVGKGLAKQQSKLLDAMLAEPDLPEESRQILQAAKEGGGEWQAFLGQSVGGAAIGGTTGSFLNVMLRGLTQTLNRKFPNEIPDVSTLLSGWWRDVLDEPTLTHNIKSIGFDETKRDWFKKITEVLLSPDMLRLLELRGEPELTAVADDLKKAGWTTERIAALKKLYWLIPGVQDLIRMAVREAFTPEIAEKFGQYQDFPPSFAEWAKKQGLSEFWAKAYWAAHWDLPSPSQGFEMLHRGVIDQPTLELLLRALDVMPFWRDKLTQIAYSPLTRVDVRRMYGVGVLDRAGVKKAYLDLGYDDAKAEAMTEFTIRYQTSADRDLTKADILSLYRKAVLEEAEATEMLLDLGYSEDDATYLLAREDTQETERVRELSESKIKSMALAGILDQTQTTAALADLGYSAEDIQRIYKLWAIEAEPNIRLPSRTDLENFYKAGIIDDDRWIEEMYKLGYTEEYIAWYYLEMISEK